ASTSHAPVPVTGIFAFRWILSLQTEKGSPASATVGKLSRTICTDDVETGQTPLTTVQIKVLLPVPSAFTAVLLECGLLMDAGEERTDQLPVPAEGMPAFNVVEGAHMVCESPAETLPG